MYISKLQMTAAPESPVSVLSADEEDHSLSAAGSVEDPDSPDDMQEQVQQDVQMQEEVLEQEEQVVSSGNQRPVPGALSNVQPEHTSPAQTSASHPALRRRRKKKAYPDFLY